MTAAADLTRGPIRRQLIALALPLLAGNILQQLYNTIDAVIVGRFVGDGAFAAVGVAGSVMNLFLFLISGGAPARASSWPSSTERETAPPFAGTFFSPPCSADCSPWG